MLLNNKLIIKILIFNSQKFKKKKNDYWNNLKTEIKEVNKFLPLLWASKWFPCTHTNSRIPN